MSVINWKYMSDGREKYAAYLCSREWNVLKEKVKIRSGGICERCLRARSENVHHLTYKRKYAERLDDLQDLCRACHEFVSGKTNIDPVNIKSVYVVNFEHIDCWYGISDAETLANLVKLKVLPCSLENVVFAFKKAGWEGDGHIGAIWIPPFIFPDHDTYGIFFWHVKQNNNGTSWLCAAQPYGFAGFSEWNEWKLVEVEEKDEATEDFLAS